MATKQTAAEWLVEEISYRLNIRIENTIDGVELLKEAKAMEKEQIMKANIDGYEEAQNYGETSAEQYYEETYGKI